LPEVLYRKWRPKSLTDVIGQDHIVRTLKYSVISNRIAHAYLFCGPRGTGKTSTARILAKSVNCRDPREGEPCNNCNPCKSVNDGRALDLIEIDAASHRGIEDVRNIRDKVNFQPNELKYKVYIIDEVHMMTTDAFNALLKTLEEPPPHVIFILATTESHRVPATVVSRCQRFDFHRISSNDIEIALAHICDIEGIPYDSQAINLIASNSAGSLRDAENLLDQISLSSNGQISLFNVQDLLGIGRDGSALKFTEHALFLGTTEGLNIISEISNQGLDIRRFQQQVIEYLRSILLVQSGVEENMNYDSETLVKIKDISRKASVDIVLACTKIFEEASPKLLSNHTLHLELALIESNLLKNQIPQSMDINTIAAIDDNGATPSIDTESYKVQEKAENTKDVTIDNAVLNHSTWTNEEFIHNEKPEDQELQVSGETNQRTDSNGIDLNPSGSVLAEEEDHPHTQISEETKPTANSTSTDLQTPERLIEPASIKSNTTNGQNNKADNLQQDLQQALKKYKGAKFNIGSLLLDCESVYIEGDTLVLNHKNLVNKDRLQGELESPGVREHVQEVVKNITGTNYSFKLLLSNQNPDKTMPTGGHLVRVARTMGAQILEEQEKYNE